MQNKLVFLITLSFVLVLQTTSTDSSSRKTTSSGKTNKDDSQVVSTTTTLKKKTSRLDDDDDDSYNSNNRQDRFSSFGSSSKNNYRSRARGQSSYSDYNDYNDLQEWSPYGMSSNYPGPLPPSAYETGPYLSNGPNCFPLLDPQYPFFSDLCGAVPQARYALPNAFGHIERWQISQVLSAILSPISPAANNPICTRSLRLLLCPLLFPPCPTRYEPPPVLPCQPYCRLVKTQCAAPGLELLPCDLLPPTSDLCPINPTPYSSLLSSFIPPPPVGGPGFPPVLPPGALSSLLAQSAMASGLSPFGFPGAPSGASPFGFPGAPSGASPFGFPGAPLGASPFGFPGAPAIGPSSPGATGATSGAVPSPTDPAAAAAAAASASAASPPGAISPSPFPSVLPPVPFSSSMGLADPASSQFSSMLAQSGFGSGLPPPGLASRFAGPSLPPPGLASLFSASGMGPGGMFSPMNSLFGAQSLMSDSLTPILVDFPPISMAPSLSSATSRFFPRLRSATEET